jgi:hypothetical protein
VYADQRYVCERPGSYGASSIAEERLAPVRLPYQDAEARDAEMAVLVEGLGHQSPSCHVQSLGKVHADARPHHAA